MAELKPDEKLLLDVAQAVAELARDMAELSRMHAEHARTTLDLLLGLQVLILSLCELDSRFREICNRHLEELEEIPASLGEQDTRLDELLGRFQKLDAVLRGRKKGGEKPN